MAKLLSVEKMIAVEKAADAAGHSYEQMMMDAGNSIVELLLSLFNEEKFRTLALVGKGNNGGDALVALTELQELGMSSVAILFEDRQDILQASYEKSGGKIAYIAEIGANDLTSQLCESDVFLDAFLGTGIKLPLRQTASEILANFGAALQKCDPVPLILAVDCPSGLDCQTGEFDSETIPADVTLSMAAVKEGMLRLPAFQLLGELLVGDIGLPSDLPEMDAVQQFVIDQEFISACLPHRAADAHKGSFGKTLIIAGSRDFPGAALLSAKAAARSGAGLVSIASHTGLKNRLAGQIPEATWTSIRKMVDQGEAVEAETDSLPTFSSLVIGPGMEKKVWKELGLDSLIRRKDLGPIVFDAFALRIFANSDGWEGMIPQKSVITPHPGEFSALTGLETEDIQIDRKQFATKYAQKWGHVVLLKGALTVIAAPDGRIGVIPVANPALASAGSGDVLSGIIGGLLAQGLEAFEAASVGAWAHAEASLWASHDFSSNRGIVASDLWDYLPTILQ